MGWDGSKHILAGRSLHLVYQFQVTIQSKSYGILVRVFDLFLPET